jgi:hypothetical protein
MNSKLTTCIYCPSQFDPNHGEGDHFLPMCTFGEFEDSPTFRGMCPECNQSFSPLDQLLCRSTHLGFYRAVFKPNLGSRSNRGNLRQGASKHGSAPKTVMNVDGVRLVVRQVGDSPFDVTAIDQIVIETEDDGIEHVPLFRNMSDERLRAELDELGIDEPKKIYLNCDDKDSDWFIGLLKRVLPKHNLQSHSVHEPGQYRVPGRTTYSFSEEYFRSLAKIAFHYYLTTNRRGLTGHEPEFEDLRQFIKNGVGDKDRFFRASGRQFVPFPQGPGGILVPSATCNLLAVDETRHCPVVYMQFFVSPQSLPEPYYVSLGQFKDWGSLTIDEGVRWHIFEYDSARTGRYAGRRRECAVRLFRQQ